MSVPPRDTGPAPSGRPTFRFAPSPNGELHLGHALSALVGHEMARRMGGRFLVRIEDIDIGRCRREFVAGIFEDLSWLGLAWEEPVLVQSQHFDRYRTAAAELEALGVLYPCFATRAEIAAAAQARPEAVDPDGAPLYPGLHKALPPADIARRKAEGQPYALRLDMDRALRIAARMMSAMPLTFEACDERGRVRIHAAHPERWGDAVIVRKDVPTSYHLAVVLDDALQGVTHVTRGLDLLAATDLHRLLQVLLELPAPLYHHHPLMTGADGRKLAKSARDISLRQLRADGTTPAEIKTRLAAVCPRLAEVCR